MIGKFEDQNTSKFDQKPHSDGPQPLSVLSEDSKSHTPESGNGTWVFDQGVANVFDDMLVRSVPLYEEAQRLIANISAKVIQPGDVVLDLGVSTAQSFRMMDPILPWGTRYVGVDPSEPMIEKARANFPKGEYHVGLMEDFLSAIDCNPKVVLLSLTLQFVPIEHRQEILNMIYECMAPDGVLFLFEKCLGHDSFEEKFFTELYYDFKESNGYNRQSIMAKRRSLENVLVPLPRETHMQMLQKEGFKTNLLSSWCNFSLILARR